MSFEKPFTFLSHSSKDKPFVYDMAEQFKKAGLHTFVDVEDIADGAQWARIIQQGVEECQAMLVVWSANARQSEWVERETLLALRLNKPLFIAQIDDTPLPIYLINRQATDFRQRPTQAVQRIIKSVVKAIQGTAAPPPTSTLTAKPNEHNFFKYLEQLPEGGTCARIARRLFRFAEEHVNAITFTGKAEPAFHAHLWVGPGGLTVFSVRAYRRQPAVEVPLQYWMNFSPFDDRALRLAVLEELNGLLPTRERLPDDRADLRPNLGLVKVLSEDGNITRFERIMLDSVKQLTAGS